MKTVKVKIDRSPVADLKRPFKTRGRVDSGAAGAIELAYARGYQAGLEHRNAYGRGWALHNNRLLHKKSGGCTKTGKNWQRISRG